MGRGLVSLEFFRRPWYNYIKITRKDKTENTMGFFTKRREKKENAPKKRIVPENIIVFDREKCIRCGTCREQCPMAAVETDGEGYPVLDNATCIECDICASLCPRNAIRKND